jgi:V-type H+-transporting ATPase subunit C
MSYWLIAVPNLGATEKAMHDQLNHATSEKGLSKNFHFKIPPLKVGTLDILMALSDDLSKYDTQVGTFAKKIEKTYFDLVKAEDDQKDNTNNNNSNSNSNNASNKSSNNNTKEHTNNNDIEKLNIGNLSARDYVEKFQWNEIRYPRRSPLRTLTDLILKEVNKSDEALKKQINEYNEMRTAYTTLERKENGSLLVRPLTSLVKEKDFIEREHLSTVLVVVPRARAEEWEASYETIEHDVKTAIKDNNNERGNTTSRMQESKENTTANNDQEGESAETEHSTTSSSTNSTSSSQEEKTNAAPVKPKRTLKCGAVVPRSGKKIYDDGKDEFLLYRVVVMKEGLETFKMACRERRFTIRPFKFDAAEDRADRERKVELSKKKKAAHTYLMRWCTTTYAEIFSSWIHIKAIRLYVEAVLRYGLPVSFTASLLEPQKGKDKALRSTLKQLYGKLAGSNVNLTSADPNEVDLSGLGADFYPYVYLPLNLVD